MKAALKLWQSPAKSGQHNCKISLVSETWLEKYSEIPSGGGPGEASRAPPRNLNFRNRQLFGGLLANFHSILENTVKKQYFL